MVCRPRAAAKLHRRSWVARQVQLGRQIGAVVAGGTGRGRDRVGDQLGQVDPAGVRARWPESRPARSSRVSAIRCRAAGVAGDASGPSAGRRRPGWRRPRRAGRRSR